MTKENILTKIQDIISGKAFIIQYHRNNPLGHKRRAKLIPDICIFNDRYDKHYHYNFEIESLNQGIEILNHFNFKDIDRTKFEVDENKPLFLVFGKIERKNLISSIDVSNK